MIAPKPKTRPRRTGLLRYLRLFRSDILSAQPDHLFDAKMAEFKTPFFRSYLVNQPDLIAQVLNKRPGDFPKSMRIAEGLRPLLGNSVFLSNGEEWARQRRIIDPAFEAARLREVFPAIADAGQASAEKIGQGDLELEAWASRGTADVIFRVLFSVPIDDRLASEVFTEFQMYQRTQPIVNLGAFVPLPRWFPRFVPRRAHKGAARIRSALAALVARRAEEIAAGTAPDDLATRIMTTRDNETGERFSPDEMVDQVAIFFLAGHETSAAAIGWALYLLAANPEWQARAAEEVQALGPDFGLGDISGARVLRNVFRETLRLYPPVPMMVRETVQQETFRNRVLGTGSQIVISPWHLHRHRAHWDRPDEFDPGRFDEPEAAVRDAYLPFSSGSRVCPGAGIAMIEGPVFLAHFLKRYRLETTGQVPVPVAHLTVRSRDGIYVRTIARPDAP